MTSKERKVPKYCLSTLVSRESRCAHHCCLCQRQAAVNEIRILASLSCPYMIRFYEAFIEGDQA